jgi:hypothetical protein
MKFKEYLKEFEANLTERQKKAAIVISGVVNGLILIVLVNGQLICLGLLVYYLWRIYQYGW